MAILIIDFLDLLSEYKIMYLVVDGFLNGTGIRDYYNGGYIEPRSLNISTQLIEKLNRWLSDYETQHYSGYKDVQYLTNLDEEGKQLAKFIKEELGNVKVSYYSDYKLETYLID